MPSLLIVDDDRFMVEILVDLLKNLRFEIHTAYSIEEMWEILDGTNIDILLLDILFPDDNAFNHLPELKKRFPTMGIILISAKKEKEVILKALRSGVIDFIPKPVDENEVEFVVKNAYERVRILKENERLTRSLHERLKIFRMLLDASVYINSSLDVKNIMERVLQIVKNIFMCEGSSILLYDPGEEALIFNVVVGGSQKVKEVKLKKDQGIAGWCFTHKREVIVEDVYSDPRFASFADKKSNFKTKSLVAVPIITSEKDAIGVLELINISDIETFKRENHLDALKLLANQIAVAIQRANLLEEVIRMNKELDEMNVKLEERVVEQTRELREALEKTKAMQERLIVTEKIAAIGELAAGVAHELNNALGFVTSNFFSMKEYLEELGSIIREIKACNSDHSSCKKIKEAVENKDIEFILSDIPHIIEESQKGIDHVQNIIKNLKLMSRADKGNLETANINDLIRDAVEFSHGKLKRVNYVNIHLGELQRIECYPHKLTQVFINIINNAVDAVADKMDSEIEIKTWEDEQYQYVSIKDNGPGIPEDLKTKIFDPFFTTKDTGKGTGLGLSVSKGIVEEHYGELYFESESGKGTTFIIKIPKNLGEIIEEKKEELGRVE